VLLHDREPHVGIERGAYDAKALITTTHPLERTLEAYQEVADRTTVTAMIVFS
jgi:hypothetical protein